MASELILTFQDETGSFRRIVNDRDFFTVGRGPDNDLQIPNNALSRRHAEIKRFAAIFILSDAGSSNGTTVNGESVEQPVALKDGDRIMLGGAVEIEVEVVGNENAYTHGGDAFTPVNDANQFAAIDAENETPLWKNVFLIAPLAGFAVLVLFGGLFLVFSGSGRTESNNRAQTVEIRNHRAADNKTEEEPEETPTPRTEENENTTFANSSPNSSPPEDSPTPAVQTNELDRVEKYALQFLRSISADTQAVLTAKQLQLVNAKIKSYKSSAALRENLRAARRNSSSLASTASAQNLKPNFLAAAALAKLNETPGDAANTAAAMAEDLGKLSGVLGVELANDCLIVVAAYEEGGSTLAMRDKLQNLTQKTPNVSPAIVRTVWFLKENGKLSDSAFDLVLRFLAIGTIAQNPREFGIDAESLS